MSRFSLVAVTLTLAILGLACAATVTGEGSVVEKKADLGVIDRQVNESPEVAESPEDTEGPEGPTESASPDDMGSTEEPSPDGGDDDDDPGQVETSTPTSEDDDDPICFPSSARVQLHDGRTKRMDELELGDKVMIGNNQFSDVFMFTHKLANVARKFLQISTEAGNILELTPSHFLYVNDKLAPAESVVVGDNVFLADGSISRVVSVQFAILKGLYNPQTVQGDIVVNGIRASTYTKTIEPTTAHALLAPLRMVYEKLGLSTTAIDHGADKLARLIPQAMRSE